MYKRQSVEGVDYPAVTLDQAYHDDDEGILYVRVQDGDKTKSNKRTTIEVFNLPDSASIKVLSNGTEYTDFDIIDPSRISLRLDIKRQEFKIITGYLLSPEEKSSLNKKLTPTDDSFDRSPLKAQPSSSRLFLPRNLISCSCC